MFTGLIETMGAVVGARFYGKSVELCIKPDMSGFEVEIGGSVAVDGACLTLEKLGGGGELFFTAVSETLSRTTLARPNIGRRVNLERAMRADGRLDGHGPGQPARDRQRLHVQALQRQRPALRHRACRLGIQGPRRLERPDKKGHGMRFQLGCELSLQIYRPV